MSNGSGCLTSLLSIAVIILLAIAMIFLFNSCTDEAWNDGMCPDCDTRYILHAASQGLKYYACPECGREVSRYLSGR